MGIMVLFPPVSKIGRIQGRSNYINLQKISYTALLYTSL